MARKKTNTQIAIEYYAVKGLLGSLGLLPRKAAVKLGMAAGGLAYRLVKPLRRTGMRNLEMAFPEMSDEQRTKLLRGTFANLGRMFGELSQFPKATPESLAELIEFDFPDDIWNEYKALSETGRGIIIISPHMGNWEMLVYAWSTHYQPMSYLARPLDNPRIEDLTHRLRTKFGNRPINKTNAMNRAIRVLREGGILGILADVNTHPKEGVFVPFFGIDACTSGGPAMLALRTGAKILPIAGVWDEKKQKYLAIHGEMITAADTGDRKADVAATTAAFTAEVEKLVRRYPEQWLWIHKRWKSRPPGEPSLY